MLFILRKLRHSFFQPGKLRSYIAYALGEIVLIVVGILIAVQIGDWKDERKLAQQRVELIENLKEDFRVNLDTLETDIKEYQAMLADVDRFLKAAAGEGPEVAVEEMRILGMNISQGIPYVPFMGAYESAKSSGSLELIKSESLSKLLIQLESLQNMALATNSLQGMDVFTGSWGRVREKVGSLQALLENDRFYPKIFELSDQEYRELVAQKEVYAFFEHRHLFLINLKEAHVRMKELIEQILTNLETLD